MLIKAATVTLLSLSVAACAGRAPQSVDQAEFALDR
jgi:hypothetical protein